MIQAPLRTARAQHVLAAVAVLLAALALCGAVPSSGASYVASTDHSVAVTSGDWVPPTVALGSLPGPFVGTVTVAASAADSVSGIASVQVEYAPADSGDWRPLCTDTTAPYSCDWDTRTVADGSYDLRASAVDGAGLSATSPDVTVRVGNALVVVLGTVPDPVRGTVTLRADATVRPLVLSFEYAVSGTTSWQTVPGCGPTGTATSTRSCTWNTTSPVALTDDYDVRAVGADGTTRAYDVQEAVTVDNTAPTVSLSVPAGTLSGVVRLTATASDPDAGMGTLAIAYRPTGGAWITLCTLQAAPYACSLDTTTLSAGSYDLRATATDAVGNSATTPTQTRQVDNTVSSVSITSPQPDAVLSGRVPVTATASSTAGITSVTIESRRSGTSTWTTACVALVSPYTCNWDTTALAAGGYELRARLLDGASRTTLSTVVAVTVDNTPLRALDVQAVNVTTAGKPAAKDQLVLTYSSVVDTTTILPGWTGSATSQTVTFRDAGVAGGSVAGRDYIVFGNANLGQVAFEQDYVANKKSVAFPATLTATTQTVGGTPVTVVTVTLGATTSGSLRQSTTAGTMIWAPSTAARTPSGVACSVTVASESGITDADL